MKSIADRMREQLAEARAAGKTPIEWRVQPHLLERLSFEAMVEEMERTSQASGKSFLGIPISRESPLRHVDSVLVCKSDRGTDPRAR